MRLNVAGRVTLISLSQFSKALSSIVLIDTGRVICLRKLHDDPMTLLWNRLSSVAEKPNFFPPPSEALMACQECLGYPTPRSP